MHVERRVGQITSMMLNYISDAWSKSVNAPLEPCAFKTRFYRLHTMLIPLLELGVIKTLIFYLHLDHEYDILVDGYSKNWNT